MLQKLQNHLEANLSFLQESKLFLAVSGGIDSMVLLDLFYKINYEIAVLHCNFSLRDSESDEDENFVKQFCNERKIPVYVKKFETQQLAKEYKLSIQVAARKLRYDWFYKQLEENKFDYILTAHHLDDVLETFLINLSRGTGLDGLTGIPAQNDKVIRPLLPFSREEIQNYAKENNLKWREDSSNASDKYLRNKIRHDIVPIIKDLNPSFLNSFQNTIENLQQANSLVDDASSLVYEKVVHDEGSQIKIDIIELFAFKNFKAYLYQWLKQFEFTAWNDIYDLVYAQPGKQVFSENYVLLKDRDFLILHAKKSNVNNEVYFIINKSNDVKVPINMSICNVSDISIVNSNCIFVDEDKLQFPLTIRKWEEGDYFFPLGMRGKKKLSKYFKDEKFSLIDKASQWLLCSENQIVWIIGMRQDERFKVENNTINILQITLR